MATGDNYKATIIARDNYGTSFVYDFGYATDGVSSIHVDCGTAAGDFQTLVQAKWAACLPNGIFLFRYRFACVRGPHVGEIGYVVANPPVEGSKDNGYRLPNEICISLKRNTGYNTMRDRGRIFFGPVSQDYRDPTNYDKVQDDSALRDVRDLLKATLTTQTEVLKPVILNKDGEFTGRYVIHAEIASVFTHRRSRRFRIEA